MSWARVRRSAIAIALLGAAVSAGWARGAADERRFPHRAHEKLFPTCTGCHAGIVSGVVATTFPEPGTCTGCHNGTDAKAVSWTGPSRTASNLRFDHVTHARVTQASGETADCLRCHGRGTDVGARPWMVVQRAPPAECITCHAHAVPTHLAAEAKCETCHVPLARAVALSDSAVAAFPKPASHDDPKWISTHAPSSAAGLTRCATCHSRESCARCHVNAATLGAVTSLEPDARIARIVRGRAPSYPRPASHASASFATSHGALAKANIATCANCHAQSSCATCHLGPLGRQVIAKLPKPMPGSAAGVRLQGSDPTFGPWPPLAALPHGPPTGANATLAAVARPGTANAPPAAVSLGDTTRPARVSVHPDGFARAHGTVASSGRLDCAGCHQQRFCTSCHQGGGERRYHQFNFAARHASDAYARETSCASCHNAETFCRACHQQAGLAGKTTGRLQGAAHGDQPLWLLQHGQAARRGLESCAGCHQQTDCLRCHSTATRRVNPHGPDFDARRMQARSKIVCGYCHLGDPLK
jgi:hypothetical protein